MRTSAGWWRSARRVAFVTLCVLLTTLTRWAPAAEATIAPRPPQPAVDDRPPVSGYRFVPGDVLEVTIQPQQGYDRTVTIQPDGKITFPVVGEMTAAGLTPQQLQLGLEQGLQAELKRPRVTISLKEMNKGQLRRASVLGAVKIPGSYDLKERSTLAELLATAGGPTPVADLGRVTITRADGGKKVVVDLSGAARTGEVTNNATLEAGDLIIVPEGVPPTVLVLGEVAKAGSYELSGEMRLLDALSLAGGPTPKADLRRVTLTRSSSRSATAGAPETGKTLREETVLDIQDLLLQGQQQDLTANVLLQPGDTVVLPESERKFYVLGQVNKPEAYPLKPGDRLLDAITRAGGNLQEADLGKVQLLRKDETGQPVAVQVDLKRMMTKGELTQNDLLREGDIIFVPARKQGRTAVDYLNAIYPLMATMSYMRYW